MELAIAGIFVGAVLAQWWRSRTALLRDEAIALSKTLGEAEAREAKEAEVEARRVFAEEERVAKREAAEEERAAQVVHKRHLAEVDVEVARAAQLRAESVREKATWDAVAKDEARRRRLQVARVEKQARRRERQEART